MMYNNLVIGNTAQLSYDFPEDYVKISSRNINYDYLKQQRWNRVYICFGESRKFIKDIEIYDEINFKMTVNLINILKDISQNIIVYSTCELWNKYEGKIDISMPFDFFSTPYQHSKYKLTNFILKNYDNVLIMYPFNFNSIHRSTDFLFGKIFKSIIHKTKIDIGNTYFYRDLIHPKFVVNESINSNTHKIIGSGRLTFVNDFIRDLYKYYDMNYDEYVIENKSQDYIKRSEYYLKSDYCLYDYNQLLRDTIEDINKIKK